jgi:CDP-glycerol glycerophosphotransferase (TagB/SpsB family)
VFTNSLRDLSMDPHGVPETLRLVALRHGRSVKRVRFARVGHPLSADEAAERLHESRLTRHAISTSEFISDLQEQSLQIGRHKHVVTGYPRNDDLLRPDAAARAAWHGFLGGLRPKQVVLYAPTWRHGREATLFFPFPDFDERALLDFLAQRGLLLLLRPHVNDLLRRPDQRAFLEGLAARGESIRMAAHTAFPDINTILPFVDVLITDYSALYHDFLLLDRPMIFIPYDFEEFSRQNGFLYDYFDELPGPAVGTQQELCLQLERIHRGADSFEEKRKSLRDRVHSFQDSGARERVGQLIDRMLDEV